MESTFPNDTINILNSLEDGFVRADKKGKIIFANLAIAQMCGYESPEEMIGIPMKTLFVNPEERDQIIKSLKENNKVSNLQLELKRRDGTTFWSLIIVKYFYDEKGNQLGTESLIRDYTEIHQTKYNLEQANKQLAASEQQLKAANQQLTASEQQFRAVNQQLIANEQQLKAANQQLTANEQQLTAANQQLRANEQQLRATNQQLEANEQELLKSKETAEHYLNVAAEIILTLDKNGNITLLNKSGHKLLGYKNGELIGKNWFTSCLPEKDLKEIKNVFKQTVSGQHENVANYESDIQTKSGEIRSISWHNTVLKDEKGKITAVLSSGEDITVRKAAEEKFRLAMEATKDGIWDWDIKSNQVYYSPSWSRIIEEEDLDPAYSTWADRIHPDDKEKATSQLQNHVKGITESFRIEHRLRLKNGKWKWVLSRGKVVSRDDKGNSLRMIGTMSDITKQKEIEQEIISQTRKAEESEEKFSTIFNMSSSLVCVADINTATFKFINPSFKRVLGYDEKELLSKPFLDFIHPDDVKSTVDVVEKNLKAGVPKIYFENRYKRKDGSYCNLAWNSFPVPEKGITYAIAHDITEQRKAELELRKIEWLLQPKRNEPIENTPEYGDLTAINKDRTILDSVGKKVLHEIVNDYLMLLETSAAVYEKNGDYALGIFSSKWCQFMDCSARALCKTKSNTKALESGKWLCHESCWNDASKQSMSQNKPTDIQCSGGLNIYAIPITANNEVIGSINFGYGNPPTDEKTLKEIADKYEVSYEKLRTLATSYETRPAFIIDLAKEKLETSARLIGEIVERKFVEKELIIAKQKAEEADRLKSAFLANMSHEIRTPMNGILGFTNLLKEPELSEEKRDHFIQIIKKSGTRMLNTVNDIIDISKIDSGQVEVAKSEVNLNEEIATQAEFFDGEAMAKGLELKVLNKLPNHSTVITDQIKFNSIVSNLIKNAIKYTDKGSIEIHCNKNGSNIEFSVTDTGIGIAKNRLNAVFNRFEQADISDIHARQGSGLGLTITKAYVEMLGGTIGVESEPDKGSSFYFTLPWVETDGKSENIEKKEITNFAADHQVNILIVEDDDVSFEHFKIILEPIAKRIDRAVNGEETISYMKNNTDTELILMDVQMPLMNGYKASAEIRKFNKDVIIIAQTAYALEGDKEKALDAGCNDYISKPIIKERLFELTKKYFQISS